MHLPSPTFLQKNKDSKNNGSYAKYSKSWNAIDYTNTISNILHKETAMHMYNPQCTCVCERDEIKW